MTRDEANQLPPGFYVIWWKAGGYSSAAVGVAADGTRWMAPCNWVRPSEPGYRWWPRAKHAELLQAPYRHPS